MRSFGDLRPRWTSCLASENTTLTLPTGADPPLTASHRAVNFTSPIRETPIHESASRSPPGHSIVRVHDADQVLELIETTLIVGLGGFQVRSSVAERYHSFTQAVSV